MSTSPPAEPFPPAPQREESSGGEAPATLALTQFVSLGARYPQREGVEDDTYFTTGMIQGFAGTFTPSGAPRADGSILEIGSPQINEALFSLFGSVFGGDGWETFAMPNLDDRIAIGGRDLGTVGQGTFTLGWLIAPGPNMGMQPTAMLVPFACDWVPDGWLLCDGSELPTDHYPELAATIGYAFGGDGASTFALPNLNGGAAPVGAGEGPGRAAVALGQQLAGPVPGVGLNWLICTYGDPPATSGLGVLAMDAPVIGHVVAYAGAAPPAGWALCDGSLLQIADYPALFDVIGTIYGGDGRTTFALPDLRGRMVTGLAA